MFAKWLISCLFIYLLKPSLNLRYLTFFVEWNTNIIVLVCSSLCFLRFWYFGELISGLISHAERMKARNKSCLKFRHCSKHSGLEIKQSCELSGNHLFFFILYLGNLFLLCILSVCSKDFCCIYDFFTYMEKKRIV